MTCHNIPLGLGVSSLAFLFGWFCFVLLFVFLFLLVRELVWAETKWVEVPGEMGTVEALLAHSRPWHKIQINIHDSNYSNTEVLQVSLHSHLLVKVSMLSLGCSVGHSSSTGERLQRENVLSCAKQCLYWDSDNSLLRTQMLYIWLSMYNKYFSPGVCHIQLAHRNKKGEKNPRKNMM